MLGLGKLFGRTAQIATEPARQSASLPLDLTTPEFVHDPYPTYAWLRENAPVAELAGGGFLVTRHADVRAAFTDPRLCNAPSRFSTLAPRNREKYVAADLAARIPPFQDDAPHRASRQLINRAFYNIFNGIGADLDAIAQRYVAGLHVGADLVESAAQPFALQVMCRFCGIEVDPAQMKPLTQAFFHLFAPLRDPASFAAVNDALAVFRERIAASLQVGAPAGSLLAALQIGAHSHDQMSEADIIDACVLVFADGVENIEAAAASVLLEFDRAGILTGLSKGHIDLDAAIFEGLRLQTPAQLVPRVARETFDWHGVKIGKDMPVFLGLGSANMDPHVFENPWNFDFIRNRDDVVTFGKGRHSCIGAPLAMAQLKALLGATVSAGYKPDPAQQITYQTRIGHRWPSAMRVIV